MRHHKYCQWFRHKDCPCETWDLDRRAYCIEMFGSDELIDMLDAEKDGDQWRIPRKSKG